MTARSWPGFWMGRLGKGAEMNRTAFILAALIMSASSAVAQEPSINWPRWRAERRWRGRTLPIRWSKTENIRWSVKLPGWGTSSPVVYGDRVFVTSHVKEKKSLLTLCFERGTGKELWRHDFGLGVDQRTHEKSNLAVNTPAVTKDAVYVAFGNS
jgi:outer membrane protein assembly factor BamB